MCSFLGITCISAQDIDSVYSELLSLLDKKAIDWMESIEYTQRQALLLNKLGTVSYTHLTLPTNSRV